MNHDATQTDSAKEPTDNGRKHPKAPKKNPLEVTTGRVAEINHAIEQGDIVLARRLSSGEDIDVPAAI